MNSISARVKRLEAKRPAACMRPCIVDVRGLSAAEATEAVAEFKQRWPGAASQPLIILDC